MNLIRTEQISISATKELSEMCHLSKNLWNEANYLIRQEFFTTGKWLRYNELYWKIKNSENYRLLPINTSQQTLRLLDKAWKSAFAGIKTRRQNPTKFDGQVKLPYYKPKNGEGILIFTPRQFKIKDGFLTLPQKIPLKIKTRLSDNTIIKIVRIIPKGINYICEIVYKKQFEEGEINKRWYSKLNNSNRYIGIDLGVSNIVTMVNNIGKQPIVIKGGILKSINQFYNKETARLQSIYARQGIKFGTKMSKLNFNRNNRIKDQIHKISRYIIDYCVSNNIGTIVIGRNKGWKQNINIGKRNNQNFVTIPFHTLIQMIQYKAEEQSIEVKLQEEAHTSKCSFLDNESIEHHSKYVGKRFLRGLFKSAKNIIINADVNAGYNIIKKAIPNAFANGIEDVGLHPIRINPFIGGEFLMNENTTSVVNFNPSKLMFDELNNIKFITVEGADGTGKDTVAQELHKSLKGSLLVSFPYRFNLTGRLIDDILQKKKPMLDPLSFQSLMLANKIETLKDICKTICTNEKPSHIIFARYLQSSIVYGMLDEIPANFTVKINRVLPESNNVFVLHGKVYKNFENKAEYYETERKQERVSALYLKCAEDFEWNILDNNRPVKSIVSEILSTIGEQ